MDNIDIKILRLLQKNSRITASEISSIIRLSIPACSERLRKLETSGAIKQYTAIINHEFLNKKLTALIFLNLEHPKFADKFIEAVNDEADIIECHYLTGDYDYILKIITEDTSTLQELLLRLKSIHVARKTKTIVVFSTIKNSYSVIPEDKEN